MKAAKEVLFHSRRLLQFDMAILSQNRDSRLSPKANKPEYTHLSNEKRDASQALMLSYFDQLDAPKD